MNDTKSAAPAVGKHPDLVVREVSPLNAGPTLDALVAHETTPNEWFFVRNHGDIPEVDAASFRFSIGGLVAKPMDLSLGDLARLPRRSVFATLECAGNRRDELSTVTPIPGELPWGAEAISSASWEGVALADVLALAGPRPEARHVEFVGLDQTERLGRRFGFGGSIPLAKALAAEVLLADRMNGEPLPPTHGFPLRVVVPGYLGARSVKWLSRIELLAEPSKNYFQDHAYRLFPPWMNASNVDWHAGMMLGDLPVTSVIAAPEAGAELPAGSTPVSGYAFVGGGRGIARVDLSIDGGTTWRPTELGPETGPWGWRLFSANVELQAGEHELIVRAWDGSAQTQPAAIADVWNFKGYANNAWHRVRVRVV
mgnify:CR=1 FL=1